MTSHDEDIASQLLQSADVRIAEAARRVFSAATVDMTQHNNNNNRPMTIASSSGIYDETSMYTLGAAVDQMEYNTTSSTPNPLRTTEADHQHTTTSNINSEVENDGDVDNGKKVSSADRQKRR